MHRRVSQFELLWVCNLKRVLCFHSEDQSWTNEGEDQPAAERCRQQLQHGAN